MAPQNSTLISVVNDDIKSISSVERLSPIKKDSMEFLHQNNIDCGGDSDENDDETDEEIPIFIGHVPRYVSGVNRRTTCNDIIKALIDDELANNTTKVSKQLICEPQNYTIYERFQDIEHALDGDELILDIWKNWGTRTDVQFRLKINKKKKEESDDQQIDDEEDDRMSTKSKKIRNAGIQKLLKKVLLQGEVIQRRLNEISKVKQHNNRQYRHHRNYYTTDNSDSDDQRHKCQFASLPISGLGHETATTTDTEDELFLIIENHNDNDSGVFITKEQKFIHEMEIDRQSQLSSTPKRKFRDSRDFGMLREHAINTFNPHEDFRRASSRFEQVHREIRMKMDGMKNFVASESSFMRKIEKYQIDDDNIIDTKDYDNVNNFEDNCDNNKTMIV